jgi:hypothetical protein
VLPEKPVGVGGTLCENAVNANSDINSVAKISKRNLIDSMSEVREY